MEEVIDISYWHLGIGMLLMLFPLYYFWRLKTGLLKSAVISTVRMTVQLLLIGVYLWFLFLPAGQYFRQSVVDGSDGHCGFLYGCKTYLVED